MCVVLINCTFWGPNVPFKVVISVICDLVGKHGNPTSVYVEGGEMMYSTAHNTRHILYIYTYFSIFHAAKLWQLPYPALCIWRPLRGKDKHEAGRCDTFPPCDSTGVTAWKGKTYLLVSLIMGIAAASHAGVHVCVLRVSTVWITTEHGTHTGKQDGCWVCTPWKKLLRVPVRCLFENVCHEAGFKCRRKQSL